MNCPNKTFRWTRKLRKRYIELCLWWTRRDGKRLCTVFIVDLLEDIRKVRVREEKARGHIALEGGSWRGEVTIEPETWA